MTAPLKITGLSIALALLGGCSEPPKEEREGKKLYGYYCAGCHGDEGKGNFLRGIPANVLTDKNARQVIQLIHKGVQGDKDKKDMPAMPFLTNNQANKIAGYLLRELRPALDKSKTNQQLLLKP